MTGIRKIVVFSVDDRRFALYMQNVQRVIQAVDVVSIPRTPEYVLGIINYHGELLPVINIRKIFQLNEKDIDLNDKFMIVKSSMRTISLWVDSIEDIIDIDEEDIVKSEKIMRGIKYVDGILKFENGMILLHDLDQFLTIEEVGLLKQILKEISDKGKSKPNVKKRNQGKAKQVAK